MNQAKPEAYTTESWPELPALSEWKQTLDTVHLWTQVIGKVRLKHMPWINHSWHVTLYVTSSGLTTSLIPHVDGGFEIEFNFQNHRLEIRTVNRDNIFFDLQPMSVAEFYQKVMTALRQLDIVTNIYTKPVEIPDPIIPFPEDNKHASYDPEYIRQFWLALTHAHRVFTDFRSRYSGKVSPVHFFWGSFDLTVTRFSGRTAPKHPGGVPNCADWVMQEGYSHELSSAGFWPGTGLGEAAFYSYTYPEPKGYRSYSIAPEPAWFHEDLGEFVLPYKAVKNSADPEEVLITFLQSTYEAAAANADWDRKSLEKRQEIP